MDILNFTEDKFLDKEYKYKVLVYPNITFQQDLEKDSYVVVLGNIIRELNKIGDDVSIGTLSVVEHHVVIGNRVRIHTQVFVPEYCKLEDNCWLGPNTVLTNASYPKHSSAKDDLQGVTVGKNAKIGANVTLLPGIKVGENALVGAGSVITKDVNDGVIVAGNPVKILREIDYT